MTAKNPPQLKLLDFIDAATLERLQDSLSAVAQVSVSFLDPQGRPIIPPACTSEFCRLIRQSHSGRNACHTGDVEAARLAQASETPQQHTCHAGLIRHVAPITVDGRRLGSIIIADLLPEPLPPHTVRQLAKRHGIDPHRLAAAAAAITLWSHRRITAAAEFLQFLANALARLCHQEHQIHLRTDELGALYQAAGLLAGAGDLQETLDRIADTVCRVMKAKASSIRLLDEQTGELTIKAVANLSSEYLDKGPVTVAENPIDADAIAGNLVYVGDSRKDPRVRYPAQARSEGLVSALIAGMLYRNRPVGVMRIYMGTVYQFTDFEQSLLKALASQAATAVVNARLYQDALAAERYQRQLQYAAQIQRRMIPQNPPIHAHLQFGTVYDPVMEVSGDFYDFIKLGEGHLGITIADVVGKGVPASLMMASLRSALRTYAEGIYDLAQVMARANRHLYRDTLTGEFATAFYGVVAPDARRLTYCNAGHDPPLLFRDGRFETLEVGGTALGILPNEQYDKGLLHLRPGDILVFYTDGLTEAMNFQDQQFTTARLRKSILRYQHLDAQQLAHQLLWDVRRFIGLADRTDDITIVTVKVLS